MTSNLVISLASLADIPQLVELVNSAYRGESSKRGWTTEADLLGGIRTNEGTMQKLMEEPGSILLQCRNENKELLGCVNLQKQQDELYLGMLTVSPNLQGGGIGKELLSASEQYARQQQLKTIAMTVISIRSELIAWYERRGYYRTGETKPFPSSDPSIGIPKQPLEFVVLKKAL